MVFRLLIGLSLAALPLAAASAMPVSTFLNKANTLKKKGPLAMFSGDLKLLMTQVKTDAGELRSERLAAKAAGTRPAFCPPEGGAKLTRGSGPARRFEDRRHRRRLRLQACRRSVASSAKRHGAKALL